MKHGQRGHVEGWRTMAGYDLHDEMNPARLIGPVAFDSVTSEPSRSADPPAAPAGQVHHATGDGSPSRGAWDQPGLAAVALVEPEIDQELDPMLWRDVCDPQTPPAPVVTGLDALGFGAHSGEGGVEQTRAMAAIVLAEAPTVPVVAGSRWRTVVLVAGAVVALLVLPLVLVFTI